MKDTIMSTSVKGATDDASASSPASSGSQGHSNNGSDSSSVDGSDIDTELVEYLKKLDVNYLEESEQFAETPGTVKKWNELVADSEKIKDKIGVALRKKRLPDFVPESEELSEAMRAFTEKSEALQMEEIEQDISELGGKFTALGFNLNWPETSNRSTIDDLHHDHTLYIDHYNRVEKIQPKIAAVYNQLKEFSALSNDVTAQGTKTAELEKENAVSEGQYREMMKGVHIPSPSKAQMAMIEENAAATDPPWWPQKVAEDEGKLKEFSKHWCHLVQYSTKYPKKNLTKNLVTNTTEAILGWEKRVEELYKSVQTKNFLQRLMPKRQKLNNEEQGQSLPQVENPPELSLVKKNFKKLAFPSCVSSEKEAVQPILSSVIRALSRIPAEYDQLNAVNDSDELIARVDQRRERYMKSRPGRAKRFVDSESTALRPFNPILLDHESYLSKEMKNICRSNGENAQTMNEQCSNQVRGHLAKRTLAAYNIANLGIDSKSVGLVMTPVYIQVIEMNLQNMGSKDVSVKFKKSKLLPLVDEEAFEAFVSKETHNGSYNYLQNELTFTKDGIPAGIHHLWSLLHTKDEDLGVVFFQNDRDQASFISWNEEEQVELATLLGAGSHGLVYAAGRNDAGAEERNYVVKASAIGESIYIKKELIALNALKGSGTDGDKYISNIKHYGHVEYLIRQTINARVPAFLMEPAGISALSHLSSLDLRQKDDNLITLWRHMNDGLAYAHGKHVIHLDVSPPNIIYARESQRFVLIDWGCAATGEVTVKGFYGTLPFAHAEVHKKKYTEEWTPKAEHDKASLLFTLFALNAGTPVPWSGFNRRLDEDTGVLKKRRDDTKNFLKTFVGKNFNSLPFLIPSEESTATQQKRRSPRHVKPPKDNAIAHLLKQLNDA